MKIVVVAVGQKLPGWAQDACEDYLKRFPAEWRIEVRAVKTEPRSSGKPAAALMAAERERIDSAIASAARDPVVIAFDEHGEHVTTWQMATRLQRWERDGRDIAMVIGGPDGLDPGLKQAADARWRLSDLTLPHAMVRVLVSEQLYRAWSILAHHPYHRE